MHPNMHTSAHSNPHIRSRLDVWTRIYTFYLCPLIRCANSKTHLHVFAGCHVPFVSPRRIVAAATLTACVNWIMTRRLGRGMCWATGSGTKHAHACVRVSAFVVVTWLCRILRGNVLRVVLHSSAILLGWKADRNQAGATASAVQKQRNLRNVQHRTRRLDLSVRVTVLLTNRPTDHCNVRDSISFRYRKVKKVLGDGKYSVCGEKHLYP